MTPDLTPPDRTTPDLMTDELTGGDECHGPTCITCADVAVPVTVLRLLGDGLAMVDTGSGGPDEEVSIALVDAGVGDVVLVHAGEAIAKVDPTRVEAS